MSENISIILGIYTITILPEINYISTRMEVKLYLNDIKNLPCIPSTLLYSAHWVRLDDYNGDNSSMVVELVYLRYRLRPILLSRVTILEMSGVRLNRMPFMLHIYISTRMKMKLY